MVIFLYNLKKFYLDVIKNYRLYRQMAINGHFSILLIHFCLDKKLLGSIFKPQTILYLKPSYNEPSYKEVSIYMYVSMCVYLCMYYMHVGVVKICPWD